ncbi:AraC family transcriptional regulator [Rhizobium sp. CNPSo 4039]|uniref:helix-turn-helix domain-containing protein n=1 Tax=Rhizobium sp. CNPSo 4039 TaxID=3021409 RepID=UPI00254F8FF6|nr:AraC family transcriptional regulator [Rhizobium sp. CNPSo 4039]MDK4716035.1 AraC family transcriptional regulator [Rhizobium sp. CNPSo 4039]
MPEMVRLLQVSTQNDIARRDCAVDSQRFPENERNKVRRVAGLSEWQKIKVARYIDEHIDGCIRVEELGLQVRLSASRFSKGFKESFGRSPYDYVLLRRVEAAKFLIATTQEPLSQIAQACGLSDQAHLSKIFKRVVGMTPLRWRRTASASRSTDATADRQRWARLSNTGMTAEAA